MASTALITRALKAPQTRQIARAAGLAAVQALGRSRRRRAQRGRWYAGKRLGIPPNRQAGTATTSVRSLPAAFDSSITQVAGTTTWTKHERCATSLDCESGENGALYNWQLCPMEATLFPILRPTIPTYSQYKFTRLEFHYVPKAGTTANGNIYMGFDPQVHYHDSDFPDVSVISNLPVSTTSTVRNGCKLTIPLTNKAYFITVPESSTYDPLNYFLGQLVIALQGDNIEEVGDLWVDYSITLIRPKLDTSTHSSELNAVAGTVTRAGFAGLRAVDTDVYYMSSPRPYRIIADVTNGAGSPAFAISRKGVPIAYTRGVMDGGHFLGVYELPATPWGVPIEITHTDIAAATLFFHEA